MSIGEDMRLLIADSFIKTVDELEKIGIRRDLALDGMERALQMLKQRERPPRR